ncbi:hypothetical protein C0995_000137 [Termitomyces sp. Mi166|nr:hypothetical protein C0995_000137 [Termitomyces sp. Mi166\
MSISRQLARDLFRMFEEPLIRPGLPGYFGGLGHGARSSLLDGHHLGRPALDLREEGSKYVLEAELPGVRKDNIEVRIGDAGKSVTIEGKVVETRGAEPQNGEASSKAVQSPEGDTAVTKTPAATDEAGNQISSERTFVHNTSFRRTVWLPRPVDSHDVAAKLDHGILTLTLKKAKDKGSVVVPVE